MDKMSNINKNSKEIFPLIITDTSEMKSLRKKEDSRKSSERISISDNYSINNSSKGIQHYNFNKTHSKPKEQLTTKNLFSSVDFPEKKRKINILIINVQYKPYF